MTALGIALWLTASANYEAVRKDAEPIPNLGSFLERYVGNCHAKDVSPDFDKKSCLSALKRAQRTYRGKRLLIEISDLESRLNLIKWDKNKQAYRFHLTPLFSERNYGLSVGRPQRLNKQGFPVIRNLPIWVRRDEAEPEFIFKNRFRRGKVRLELIVTPVKTWRFSRKKTEDLAGVEVKLLGLRLYESRGSKLLAEQTY